MSDTAWQRAVPPKDDRGRPKPPPGRMASTFAQLPFVRGASLERRREWHRILAEARQSAAKRRDRVLAQPEVAQRLVTTLGYRLPGNWNGYLPAEDGPIRRELVDILNAVVAAETAERTVP